MTPSEPTGAGTGPSGEAAADHRRAQVIGAGLIGGSVGLALRRAGWTVTLDDLDPDRIAAGLARGVADAAGFDTGAQLVVIATPVGAIVDVALDALARTDAVVTDVGSVKGPVLRSIDDPRFVGGHPMAGSEQEGIDGSQSSMFDGATWVITPTVHTDPNALATVHSVVASLGAEVVTLSPESHDEIVAMISHVPHLAAVTLMGLASGRAENHSALLRMAAGGFRDMTRIAAGHPGIWPDICAENRDAIGDVLDELLAELTEVRDIIAAGDRPQLLARLESARSARLNLPTTVRRPDEMAEVRIGVPDRPGELAAITTLATELSVNIYDIEIAHSAEGAQGVLIVVVEQRSRDRLTDALVDRGYRVSWRELT